jgi:DNA-binding ferritin-like protein
MQSIQELSCFYISLLRTIAIVHQSHHWLARGDNFYGNHLLFDRIYKTAAEDSDLAAEKFIGLFGNSALNLNLQAKIMGKLLEEYTGEDLIKVSMDIENRFLKFSENIYKEIKNDGKLSLGLDDMLMSIASNREGAVYLLGQVLNSPELDLTKDNGKMAARAHILNKIVLNSNYGRGVGGGLLMLDKDQLLEALKQALKAKDWYFAGKINAKFDLKFDGMTLNGAESIRVIKYFKDPEVSQIRVPIDKWLEYTAGYCEGAGRSRAETLKDLKFTQDVIDNINKRNNSKS